ncbi:hypothetical protein ASPFODRAFT_43896 [Aspergillus luchuensis CBS 106.47]|uniref:Uncharacterized protein n=1 Tax=Aspergillus luchuensis (strain CBS 106.47) TaxID=1137211 RepID=A0A1M3TNL2_ASPLC|nr:hypothetical protein ASPFODRAFT_43896 [Aspergillus luchuensis CBS 106.47]
MIGPPVHARCIQQVQVLDQEVSMPRRIALFASPAIQYQLESESHTPGGMQLSRLEVN